MHSRLCHCGGKIAVEVHGQRADRTNANKLFNKRNGETSPLGMSFFGTDTPMDLGPKTKLNEVLAGLLRSIPVGNQDKRTKRA